MKKTKNKKLLATFLSCAIVVTSGIQSSFAITGDEVAKDKSYISHSTVQSDEDFDGYDVDVSFDVVDGNFANITVSSSNMHKSNRLYKNMAENKIKALEGKAATLENLNNIDSVSGATYTLAAVKTAMSQELENAEASTNGNLQEDPAQPGTNDNSQTQGDMVYGKLNLSYADFYYGELNNLTETSKDMDLDSSDSASSIKAAGMYDAVSSVTPSKYKSMFPSTYSISNENGQGGKILGVKDVDVAIDKKLYDDAMAAINAGRTSNNPLLDLVKNLRLNDSSVPNPTEYKIINGNGTLTKTVEAEDVVVDNTLKSTISTTDRYGHYGIRVESEMLPAAEDINGVIVKTSDGKLYAMKHLENIWRNPKEISFAAKDGFVEPHGNKVNYMAYSDIQGKTITEVRYLVRNKADLVVNTNLFCKNLLGDDNGVTIADKTFSDGVQVIFNANAPENSSYTLASISKGRTVLEKGVDYNVDGNTITFVSTDKTGIGAYIAKFEDDMYADMLATFTLNSGHEDGSVKIENNKLVLPEGIDKVQYYASITRVSVDGKALRGRDLAKTIFGDDQNANFDAAISHRGTLTPIFTKAENESYEIELISAGYPNVRGTLSKVPAQPQLEERTLTESNVSVLL